MDWDLNVQCLGAAVKLLAGFVTAQSEVACGKRFLQFFNERDPGQNVQTFFHEGVGLSILDGAYWAAPNGSLVVCVLGNICNADALLRAVDLSAAVNPAEQIALLFGHHGADLFQQLRGDYQVVIWQVSAKKLLMVQSPFLSRQLYYTHTAEGLMFATRMPVLKSLLSSAPSINPQKVAEWLICDHRSMQNSFYQDIFRLPSGHQLHYSDHHLTIKSFWSATQILTPVHYGRREAYIEAFREVFAAAVQRCIEGNRTVGAQLSGGLDSSSISAVAANMLSKKNTRLWAFGSVPPQQMRHLSKRNWNADDRLRMQKVAQYSGNIDLQLIEETNPAIPFEQMATFAYEHGEGPFRNPFNMGWISAIYQDAAAKGLSTLLTGQCGNSTASWAGQAERSLYHSVRHGLSHLYHRSYPRLFGMMAVFQRFSLIHPEAVSTYRLGEREQFAPKEYTHRHGVHLLHQTHADCIGAIAGLQDYFNLSTFDPTADLDLIDFCLQVPNEVFYHQGMSRCLIREAMQGVLPDEIRFDVRRGAQGVCWFAMLKPLVPFYLSALQQWEKLPLIPELLDLQEMRLLLNQLGHSQEAVGNVAKLEASYKYKLSRGLHTAQWLALHVK